MDTNQETTFNTPARPRKANGKAPTQEAFQLTLETTTCEIALGTKRSNKAIAEGKGHLNVTIQADYTKLNPAIASAVLREGFTYLCRQEVAKVEKEIDTERQEARESGAPWSEPDLNERVRIAVTKRLEAIYAGELGRRKNSLSYVERKAVSLLRDAIAAHFRKNNQAVSNERLDELTEANWKANENNIRQKLTAKAEEILAEEARRASTISVDGLTF